MSIANEIQRLQTAKANIKAAIESKGVTVPSSTTIDGYAQIIIDNLIIDPYAGQYVEIGGTKWATMNVGANSATDTGLYFQWGDTQGYTAAQVGSDEGQKYFSWEDYKYSEGGTAFDAGTITKYNESDGLTTLQSTDDAVKAALGGNWRMPTVSEFIALGEAVTSAWTADYQGSGVSGLVLTDKTDSSKVLFFPACGNAFYGSVGGVGDYGRCWSSSLYADSGVSDAFILSFYGGGVYWDSHNFRCSGLPVRGVLDE